MHVLQLTVVGIINGSLYALLAVGFGLILQVTGRFHIAFAVTFAFAGYSAAYLTTSAGMPFWAALVIGAMVAAILGMAIEGGIYWPLGPRAGNFVLLAIFTASLGLMTIGQGLIGLILLNSGTAQISGLEIMAIDVGGLFFTNLDVISVVLCWVLIITLSLVLVTTKLGRIVRATRSNVTMSLAVGISPRMVYIAIFGIGSALGGVGGVLETAKAAVSADSGQSAILYALTIAFLAGMTASPMRVALVGLGLGVFESLSNIWLSPVWNPVLVYSVLLIYAAIKPFNLGKTFRRKPTRIMQEA